MLYADFSPILLSQLSDKFRLKRARSEDLDHYMYKQTTEWTHFRQNFLKWLKQSLIRKKYGELGTKAVANMHKIDSMVRNKNIWISFWCFSSLWHTMHIAYELWKNMKSYVSFYSKTRHHNPYLKYAHPKPPILYVTFHLFHQLDHSNKMHL